MQLVGRRNGTSAQLHDYILVLRIAISKVTENGTNLNITTWFDNYILRTTLAMLIRSTLAILTVRQMLWYIAANQVSFAWKIKMKSHTDYCGEFYYK